jgi:ubiquinone biosynthesis protein Coq4
MKKVEEAKRRWKYINRMWCMGLPVKFLMAVTGHTTEQSFRTHMKHLRESLGSDWFPPRQLGFKPIMNLSEITLDKEEIAQ